MSAPADGRHPGARAFDRVAAEYERGRPGYPAVAVRFLGRVLGLRRGRTVVELGSGTGKLTRALTGSGAALIAVDPSEGMREEFRRRVPDVLNLAGAAEAIPLPDGLADAVVAAQAFHWFRPAATSRELARVLRAGGKVGLVWNVRDRRDPLVRRIDTLVDRHTSHRPSRWRHWERAFDPRRTRFGRLSKRTFRYVRRTTPATLVEQVLSTSRVALLAPAERRALVRELKVLLAGPGSVRGARSVRIPTRTEVYWTRLTTRAAGGRVRRRRRTARSRRTGRTSRGSGRPARRTGRGPPA